MDLGSGEDAANGVFCMVMATVLGSASVAGWIGKDLASSIGCAASRTTPPATAEAVAGACPMRAPTKATPATTNTAARNAQCRPRKVCTRCFMLSTAGASLLDHQTPAPVRNPPDPSDVTVLAQTGSPTLADGTPSVNRLGVPTIVLVK